MLKGLVGRMRRARSETRSPKTKNTPQDNVDKDSLLEGIQRIVNKCDTENQTAPGATEDACCVCMERVPNVTAYPCAHKVTCRRCSALLIKEANDNGRTQLQCVLCRSIITKFRYTKKIKITVPPSYELLYRHPSESSGSSFSGSSSSSGRSTSFPIRGIRLLTGRRHHTDE